MRVISGEEELFDDAGLDKTLGESGRVRVAVVGRDERPRSSASDGMVGGVWQKRMAEAMPSGRGLSGCESLSWGIALRGRSESEFDVVHAATGTYSFFDSFSIGIQVTAAYAVKDHAIPFFLVNGFSDAIVVNPKDHNERNSRAHPDGDK